MTKRTEDPDNPEWTAADVASARRGVDHLPGPMRDALLDEQARRRGRGPQRTPTKILTSIRLDPDVVTAFKSTGAGWQGRINAILKRNIRKTLTPDVAGTVANAGSPTRRHSVVRKAAKKR